MAVGICLIGVALGELGTRDGSTSSAWTGHAVAAANLALGATMLFPWPIFVIGFWGFPLLGWFAVARGATNGVFPPWFMLAFGFTALAAVLGSLGGIDRADLGPALLILLGANGFVLTWLVFSRRGSGNPTLGAA